MELFSNELNFTDENSGTKKWLNYKEQRYLPSFCVDFPYQPIIISDIEVRKNKGKLYKCDTSLYNPLNSNIFSQYLLYYFPIAEKHKITENNIDSFLSLFISDIFRNRIIKNMELSNISCSSEKTLSADFYVTALRISSFLCAGRIFISDNKYVHLLIVKPRHLVSVPDYNRFVNSFKLIKD